MKRDDIMDNFRKLLNMIKNTKLDENYKPKEYTFGLKNFSKIEDKKKRENKNLS